MIINDFLPLYIVFYFHADNCFAGKVSVFKQQISFILEGNSLPSVSQAAAKSSQAYCTLPATDHNATAA